MLSGFLSKPEQILSRALFRQPEILNHSLETLRRREHIAINGIGEIFHAKAFTETNTSLLAKVEDNKMQSK